MKSLSTYRHLAAAVFMGLLGAVPSQAQDDSLFGGRTASVAFGPYFRAEVGYAAPSIANGYWRPPGYDPAPGIGDPEIRFDLDGEDVAMGSLAIGYDWQGWRGEVAVSELGSGDVSGPCSSASDGSSCSIHANIDNAPVSSTAIMANVFYAPFEARGSQSVFQPFFVAGLGVARNDVGDWTRSNPGASRPIRSFEGASTTSLAWSVGVGASYQLTGPGEWPVLLEGSLRYYDLGSAEGGSIPLPGNGASEPVQPLTFDNRQSVIAIGVRIPLQRF